MMQCSIEFKRLNQQKLSCKMHKCAAPREVAMEDTITEMKNQTQLMISLLKPLYAFVIHRKQLI